MPIYKLPENAFSIKNKWDLNDFLALVKKQEEIKVLSQDTEKNKNAIQIKLSEIPPIRIFGKYDTGHVDIMVKIITHIEEKSGIYHGRLFISHSMNFAEEYRVYSYDFNTNEGKVFERTKKYEDIFEEAKP